MTSDERDPEAAFALQGEVRGPWRAYLDGLEPLRPELHRYCTRLTGSVWDGEDLAQDALMKVFSLLGKIDADLEQPRAYLIRTATPLFIDRQRRLARARAWLEGERAEPAEVAPDAGAELEQRQRVRAAGGELLQRLAPRERAALMLKDVFDLSLEESASVLRTTVGAVKAALHRGRGRLSDPERDGPAPAAAPPAEVIDRYIAAMAAADLEAIRAICSEDVCVELVGGNEMEGLAQSKGFFKYAHMALPQLGFGDNPNWRPAEYRGEPIVLGFRTLEGAEGLNEVHRLELDEGRIARVRCYCFAPDTLRVLGEHLDLPVLPRRYRSPDPAEVQAVLAAMNNG